MRDDEHLPITDSDVISKQLNNQKPSIIIVGSPTNNGGIIEFLPRQLYDLHQSITAGDLNVLLSVKKYDLVILDVSVPDADNLSLIRALSSISKSFYLFVRSETDDQVDTVLALELGADDCVALSCSPREIKARVRALLRRRKVDTQIDIEPSAKRSTSLGQELSYEGWSLHGDRCQLLTPAGDFITLTKSEYVILVNLFTHPGLIKVRSDLINIDTESRENDIRSLDVFVSRLRKKMARYDGQGLIETVRGRGYRLNTTVRRIG